MEVIRGLWMVEGLGQCYIYQDADTFTLIDAGLAGSAEQILDELARVGGKPEQLRQIILTHSHPDHVGGVADLAEKTNAQVLAHELDVPVIAGEADIVIPTDLPEVEQVFMDEAIENTPLAPPAHVDRALQDGDEIDLGGGARVVHVPGHTPGSIAIYMPKEKLLFAGDTAERDLQENLILGMFNLDRPQAIESFKRLAQLDFEIACLGHGRPENKDACLAFRRLAEKL